MSTSTTKRQDSDRERFQAMFGATSKRQFDVLLFWSLDRMSREGVLPTLQHLQRLTSYGTGYRSFYRAEFRLAASSGTL